MYESVTGLPVSALLNVVWLTVQVVRCATSEWELSVLGNSEQTFGFPKDNLENLESPKL